MAEQIIDAYIEYLRNVSRKIISKSGFEDIFPEITRKRNHYYTNFEENKNELISKGYLKISPEDTKLYRRLSVINEYLQNETEYKLFIGSGLLIGKIKGSRRKQFICAPLFYCPLDIDYENRSYELEFEKDSIQLNQDLIARIFDLVIDEEFDEEFGNNGDLISKFKTMETLENKYADKYSGLFINSTEFLNDLKTLGPDFKNIEIASDAFDMKIRESDELNELEKVLYFNHSYLFVNRVPHELSTYEALNTLLKNKPLENKLLNKLFQNILTDRKAELNSGDENKEDEILNILDKYIPLTLSDNQKTAIKKAWTSELSYIQGPPGTGKSYTIAALILSAIFLKKKVLLVSHKDAAVNIVKEMIDNILGNESLLYIGSHSESKRKTKEYLEEKILSAESFNYLYSNKFKKLETEVNRFEYEINRLHKLYKDTHKRVSELLNAENDFYKLHEEFIGKREMFSNNFQVENIKQYHWVVKKYSEEKYLKAINKYAIILRKIDLNRINVLYITKFIKHFVETFRCNLEKIKADPVYAVELFQLHYLFSKTDNILRKINKNELTILRKDLNHLQEQLFYNLKEYLPLYWKYLIALKLVGPENKNLRDEIDSYKRMLHFKKANIVQGKMKNLNFDDILNVFPLWCSELRDLGKSVDLENELFDLVIIDESSQVNIAEIIPAFYRGKKFCVVGDKNQLNLNATGVGFALSNTFDKLSWQESMVKYEGVISYEAAKERNLIVTHSSILDFVSSESNDFTISTTMLDEHFRSLPPLAKFTSKNFYDDKWKIMTENGENVKKVCFMPVKVDGSRDISKKIIKEEINRIDRMLYLLNTGYNFPELEQFNIFRNGSPFTYGILSFLTNQVREIRQLVENKYEELQKKHKIFIATPEEFQGNERDIMIISLGLDSINKWGKGFYENPNRFNVATSRAKYFTYLVYAGLPVNIDLIGKYFSSFGHKTSEESETAIPVNNKGWKFDIKNCESEFEIKVYNYLLKYKEEHNNELEIYNQVHACGQKRLDFVLFDPNKKVTCAIEVDGKDHFIDGSYRYNEAHLSRMALLKRAGWKVINIKYYNWWDNGWLCDSKVPYFESEIYRLYKELGEIFCVL
ncbi:MAG: AAA domain-containing protein [Ignavibacteria bacterium]|nr:AAA domain-containing protein [Ignavibacteria bacterium]